MHLCMVYVIMVNFKVVATLMDFMALSAIAVIVAGGQDCLLRAKCGLSMINRRLCVIYSYSKSS